MNRSESQWEQPELSVPVVRGVRTNKVDTKNVGAHWTTSEGVASYFQQKNLGSDLPFRGTATIRGEVPISSLETNKDTLKKLGVGNTQNYEGGPADEKEVTARKGAPVKIKSITTIGPKKRTNVSRAAEQALDEVHPNPDYQKPGDSEKWMSAAKTLNRQRVRTFNPPRTGTA